MLLKSFKNVFKKANTIVILQNRLYSVTVHDQATTQIIFPDNGVETRLLKVAIIGMPNAGKSTFINNLMERKVCPTSSKVHTTRKRSLAIFTEGKSQIVFLDTPGLVNLNEQKKFNLEKTFLRDSRRSLQEADIVGVIHDISNVWTREKLDTKVIRLLEAHDKTPSFLVFNKVDILKSKRKLLDLTRLVTENCVDGKPIPGSRAPKRDENVRGWPNFKEIFMVSSLMGSGLSDVKTYLTKIAKPGEWLYPGDVWTDESPEKFITNAVKAKLLDFLPQEIPYVITPEIEYFNANEDGVIKTVVLLHCPSERIAKLVAGAADGKLKQIMESIQHDLQNTFQNYVKLKMALKYPPEKK